ncbi:MAG: hypothetical protein WBD09_11455 [Halobacteriota archaeon]
MKIPLHLRKAYPGEERLFAYVPVTIRAPRIYGQINALVDTGSPRTVIAPKDAVKLKVPFKILPRSAPKDLRIGGVTLPAYSLKGILLGVIDENRTMKRIDMPMINVLNRPQQYKGEINHIPSILGTDFLEDNKLALYFDPYNKIAYLEDTSIKKE